MNAILRGESPDLIKITKLAEMRVPIYQPSCDCDLHGLK